MRYALTHVFPGSPYWPHEPVLGRVLLLQVPVVVFWGPTLSRGSCVSFLHAVAPGERRLHEFNNNTIKMATVADLAAAYGIAYLPADGVMPKDTNRGDGLCSMTWAMLGVATVLVAGRVMSKVLVLNKFGLDDGFLLLTWVRLQCFIRSLDEQYANRISRHVLLHMLQACSLRIIMDSAGTQYT